MLRHPILEKPLVQITDTELTELFNVHQISYK